MLYDHQDRHQEHRGWGVGMDRYDPTRPKEPVEENPYQTVAALVLEYEWEVGELEALGLPEADFRRWAARLREAVVEEGFVLED